MLPYSTLYIKTGVAKPAPPIPAPTPHSSSSNDAGPIAGGVRLC